jgi:hypothetical protein
MHEYNILLNDRMRKRDALRAMQQQDLIRQAEKYNEKAAKPGRFTLLMRRLRLTTRKRTPYVEPVQLEPCLDC